MKTKNLMLRILAFTILIALFLACESQKKDIETGIEERGIAYDSALALKYGADAIGMKKYVMAFLKNGPSRNQDSVTVAAIQQGHMENIHRLAKEGKLVLAGPFFGEGEFRGIYIFNVNTIAEAEALTQTDPAINAGRLIMELKEWYGPAALMAVNDINEKLVQPN